MKGRRTIQEDVVPMMCPACGAEAPVGIAYGYPTGDMFEASERGELALGGCVIGSDSPTWECRACGHRWGSPPSRIDGLAAFISVTKEVRIDC